MFNSLYRCPRTIARHENGPLRDSRVRYLQHLVAEGAAVPTVKRAAELLYRAAISMRLDESSPVERTEIERAAQHWANRPYGIAKNPEKVARAFRTFTCGWLRYDGRLRESDRVPVAHHEEIEAYCSYLEMERGLSPRTIASARWSISRFFKDIPKRPLKRVSCTDIETFLARLGDEGWTRYGISSLAHRLRGFFQYGEIQGWTKRGLAPSCRGPRVYQREKLPQGPSWSDVQRLLASTDGDRKSDIRDRAILLLLAVYGLRVGEVHRLRLEDIDWERRTLTITHTKQHRHTRICPLIPSLADAISRYIREVRRPAPCSELFLRLYAPYRPLAYGGLYGIVAYRLRNLGVTTPRCGPHSLRHACATHLLAQGLTLTEIGGHLGHRTEKATRIYAKVDLAMLRTVADLDLGGLL